MIGGTDGYRRFHVSLVCYLFLCFFFVSYRRRRRRVVPFFVLFFFSWEGDSSKLIPENSRNSALPISSSLRPIPESRKERTFSDDDDDDDDDDDGISFIPYPAGKWIPFRSNNASI